MTDPRPIETRYAGCRFRSRLEARWAVAFSVSTFLTWEYEPEGFDINGTYYLPDFRVWWTTHDYSWVEIKPHGYQPTEREERTWLAMAQQTTIGGLYLLRGIEPGYILYRRRHEPPAVQEAIQALHFKLTGKGLPPRRLVSADPFVEPEALAAARSARFEHGETPIHPGPDTRIARDEATDWLRDYLTKCGGEAARNDVIRAGRAAGHKQQTLHRARLRLGVITRHSGYPVQQVWISSQPQRESATTSHATEVQP